MRFAALTIFAVTFALCAAACAGAQSASTDPACANKSIPLAILDGPAPVASPLAITGLEAPRRHLELAVADDDYSRELGLMCVLRMYPQHGMIFVFDDDAKQTFWMKNTLIPLDMIWVHEDGTVDTVAANVPASTRTTPDTEIARRGGTGKYVIELTAGEAAFDGIAAGSHLRFERTP
jgi:uncharacterized membrane protein (UPF0127 family)